MYYLSNYYAGYKTSYVADYCRINTGIFQSDTDNVFEMNLYLALINYGKNVDFTIVWEQKRVKAERTWISDYDINFINWIIEIEKKEKEENRGADNFSNSVYSNYLILILILLLVL